MVETRQETGEKKRHGLHGDYGVACSMSIAYFGRVTAARDEALAASGRFPPGTICIESCSHPIVPSESADGGQRGIS